MYRLTRDDGAELRVSGSVWEAALELAFLYGWKPAGTTAPRTETWIGRQDHAGGSGWDSRDYFSSELQYVRRADACALAEAILRAMTSIPAWDPIHDDRPQSDTLTEASPIPSRASAIADGLSSHRRNAMRRFATFADSGGFTIGGES